MLVLAGAQVVADTIVRCASEAHAFAEARSLIAAVGAPGADVSGYVLDHNQAFVGAIDGVLPVASAA
ncbi:hypothetical protein [Tsuneonella sp. SYSU-LHT278]|uniref:hypothetical protein n=1 Tax=Tsuneonella sediminis TaxID=3416089 RepID=UPI003F795F99